MALDNDTRGWILTCISAIACIAGASVICVDVLIRLLPGKKGFRIQDSNGFLSCSLSLSAGVMFFSALYRMLPESNDYLQSGGYSSKAAAWLVIGCFLAGVFGIQILSRIFHHFMPSHVVECNHTHDEEQASKTDLDRRPDHRGAGHRHSHSHSHSHRHHPPKPKHVPNGQTMETTPLLPKTAARDQPGLEAVDTRDLTVFEQPTFAKERPSLQSRMTATVQQLVSGTKASCDEGGPCFGYSNVCGVHCFKNIQSKGGTRVGSVPHHARVQSLPRNTHSTIVADTEAVETAEPIDTHAAQGRKLSDSALPAQLNSSRRKTLHSPQSSRSASPSASDTSSTGAPILPQQSDFHHAETKQHHHHVPQNAFLSLGLQTCFAIAIHKLPEGFITFATNHANPRLGFTVFLALFIHNISEGFALALPLYLALHSRARALLVAVLLGGLSQPLGAAVAAVWLHVAEAGPGGADDAVGESVYGGMFAATAGVLASVALSLLQESLELSHNKSLCMAFVFVGMGILGVSAALTA